MIVPSPVWRRDEIAFEHGKAFAFDNRVGIWRAFNNKTDRGGRVPVRRGDFTGFNQLHGNMHRIGHTGSQSRITHLNRSPPRLSCGDQLTRPIESLENILPFPQIWLDTLRPLLVLPIAL